MLSFIQFISEGSSGLQRLNRKRIASGGRKRPSSWTSDIGARMSYKSGSSILRRRAKQNQNMSENTTLKTTADQRNATEKHVDKLRKRLISRQYTLHKKDHGKEPDRDSMEDGAAYLKHIPNSDLPTHISQSKKMKTKNSLAHQVRLKRMDTALHNLRRKNIKARDADRAEWERDQKIKNKKRRSR